jgi:hypothetical protein
MGVSPVFFFMQIRGKGQADVFANYIFSGCILAADNVKLLDLSHL